MPKQVRKKKIKSMLQQFKINKDKRDIIQNIPKILDNYSHTHIAFFVTFTFQNSFGNQNQISLGQYKKIFGYFYVSLNETLMKKRVNNFFKPIMVLIPEESLKVDKKASKRNSKKLCHTDGNANTHYHGILLIHKIYKNQFCEAFVRNIKSNDVERFELNRTAFGKYSSEIFSTDIQHCLTIDDTKKAFSYSSKKFAYNNLENEDFDTDDALIYTGGLTHIQQIINSYMHFNDIKPFSDYMKSKQFTQKDLCEFLVTLKDIHPFFKTNSIVFQASQFLKSSNARYPVTEIGLLKLQSDILRFIKSRAADVSSAQANIVMTYVPESQVLQASMQFINTLILLEQKSKKIQTTKRVCYAQQKNSEEANLYTI